MPDIMNHDVHPCYLVPRFPLLQWNYADACDAVAWRGYCISMFSPLTCSHGLFAYRLIRDGRT